MLALVLSIPAIRLPIWCFDIVLLVSIVFQIGLERFILVKELLTPWRFYRRTTFVVVSLPSVQT
jgi:hypothetical protein